MRKLKLLSVHNQKKMYKGLEAYLTEVIENEEHLNTFKKVYEDAKRVKLYSPHQIFTIGMIADYLRGLPLSTEYVTYNICKMLLSFIGKNESDFDKLEEDFIESSCDLDCYYWETLAVIIYRKAWR